jgi:hypothetical protein
MSNKSHHLFEGLAHHSLKDFGKLIDSTNEKKSPPPTVVFSFILVLAAVLTFAGDTAVQVFFRKKPALDSFGLVQLVLSFFAYAAVSIYSFIFMNSVEKYEFTGSSDSYFVTGCLYCFLSLYILIKGLRCFVSKQPENNTSILTSLAREGWSQRKIHGLGEPLLVLIIGLVFSAYNVLGGAALIFSAISVWVHLLRAKLSGKNTLPEKVVSMNNKIHQPGAFNHVK